MSRIAFARPVFGPEEEVATSKVLRSGWVVGGPNLAEFEKRCADLGGAAEGVGVSSWTTGAFLVLKALGIGPGDEVIVPSLTFIASVNVIVHACIARWIKPNRPDFSGQLLTKTKNSAALLVLGQARVR